jgi:ABC-2 type transport system permease protein
MQPERLLNPAGTDDFIRLMKDLTLPSLNHLPSSWAAHTIIYGSFTTALWIGLFTIGTLAVVAFVFSKFHEKAFLYSQETRTLHKRPKVRHRAEAAKKHGKIAGLILKDLRLFVRDATQWSQLLLLGGLVVIYLLNIQNLAIQLPMVRWVVSFINLGLAGFVLAALSVRFLFPSVSMEGRSFWIIRTLPISFRTLLWCKYVIYFPPFLIFTELLVYFSNQILDVPIFFIQLSMANIFAIAFALTGLAIGIGALMPNFKADHPSKIAVGPGGVLYMLLSFSYISTMMLIQVRPVWFHVISRGDSIPTTAYVAGAILLTLLVGLLPMEWGARQLAKKEYS